jgi:hypothetical protein
MRQLALALLLVACGDNGPADKTAACHLGATQSAATVVDRKIIGAAAPYAPDLGLAARDDELRTSILARRAAAWGVVEKVLSPVPLGDPALAQQFGGEPTIPAWHTWYAHNDFDRVFKKLYRDFTPAQRQVRAPFDAATIEAGFQWNTTAVDSLPDWPEQRYLDYLAAITTDDEAQGVGGANRVSYSPGAMSHLIESYAKQNACARAPVPDAYGDDPVKPGVPVVATERVALDGCGWQAFGPYMAGNGSVTVTATGDGDADLYVRRGAAPDSTTYDCRSDGSTSEESCTVDGGGPIYVAVFGAKPSSVTVDVADTTQDVKDPACLDGEMPRDAVLVKADWHRVLDDEPLPVFDTSAARIQQRVASDATWTDDGGANPDSASIYTVMLPTGQAFRAPALHIMSKELDHWLWITLWWSQQPDTDFGADRPTALNGVWRNYKMCVSSSYLEGDPDPRGGEPGSLGDAMAVVNGGVGTPSWCSNPYLEQGEGNAATNCIGCHQHGGTDLLPAGILANEPHHGTTRVRNNFFTDYLWAIKGGLGEDLSSIVKAEVDYWDATDPSPSRQAPRGATSEMAGQRQALRRR